MAVNDYAIVVGINDYPHPTLPNLEGPENDANAFYEWLHSADGGDVPSENIELILSSKFPKRRPNVSDIDNFIDIKLMDMDLENLTDCSQGIGRKGRRLFLFFAGHGLTPRGMTRGMDEIALLTSDASMLGTGNHISGKHYGGWFWDAALFEEIILLMDCCRDVYSEAQLNVQPWEKVACDQESLGVHSFYAFSTQFSQPANEGEISGEIRGYFSAALTDGLKYAIDEQGRVTAKSLKNYIFNRMKELQNDKSYQEPDIAIHPSSASGDEIVFCEPGIKKAPVTISFETQYLGHEIVIIEGDNIRKVEERIQSANKEWHVELSIGKKYTIIQTDDMNNYKTIDVMTGKEYHFDF